MAINPEYVCMVDFRAEFVRYIVRATIPKENKIPDEDRKRLECGRFFDEAGKDRHLKRLKEYGIEKYTVEEIPAPAEAKITRMDGKPIRYSSKEEILAHIEGQEPESLIIPNLKKQLAAAEVKAQAAEQKALQAVDAAANLAREVEDLKKAKEKAE